LYTKRYICISNSENSNILELYKCHNSLAPSLCCFGRRIAVANGRISKTRRHRSVPCWQTLKRTIAIAIAASCTFAYNFYLSYNLLKQIQAVQFVLQYIGSKIIPKIVAHMTG